MLLLFDRHHIIAFNNYRKLYNHLENLERNKGKGKWIFARHSHQRVLSFYQYIRDQEIPVQISEKLDSPETVDVLEVVNGDVTKPIFIPVTPDVDVTALQHQWCQNYCKEHNYALFEISKPADFKEIGAGYDHAIG